MPKKTEIKLRKAGEPQAAQTLAKMFGVPPRDDVNGVLEGMAESWGQVFPVFLQDIAFFHWLCPVATYVMSEKMNPLLEALLNDEGLPLIVKEEVSSCKFGLWLAVAGDDDIGGDLPVRRLTNHVRLEDRWIKITAIQIETCLRKLRLPAEQ